MRLMANRWLLLIALVIVFGISCKRTTVTNTRESQIKESTRPTVSPIETPVTTKSVEEPIEKPNEDIPTSNDENGKTEMSKKTVKKLKEKPFAKIKGGDLEELSGIVPAARSGEFWGHNDQGNDPELFRFNWKGKILQKVKLKEVKNDDWEAIARGPDGDIVIGAFGDNDRKRKTYHLLQLKEPANNRKKTDSLQTFSFVYPNQKSHNCESLFLMDNRFYLITKVDSKDDDRKSEAPRIFCLDQLSEGKTVTAREIGVCRIQGKATDAAYSKETQLLAVLTYKRLFLFQVSDESDLLKPPAHTIEIDFDQCEGLCFDEDDLVITNEKGKIWRYPIDTLID